MATCEAAVLISRTIFKKIRLKVGTLYHYKDWTISSPSPLDPICSRSGCTVGTDHAGAFAQREKIVEMVRFLFLLTWSCLRYAEKGWEKNVMHIVSEDFAGRLLWRHTAEFIFPRKDFQFPRWVPYELPASSSSVFIRNRRFRMNQPSADSLKGTCGGGK